MTTDEEELLGISQAWQRAIVANDAEEIGRFASDDWVLIDSTGVGTRDGFLSLVASHQLSHSAMQTIDGTERVRVYGDMAVVTARVTNTAHYREQEFLADEWTTDVFRRTEAGWICVLSQVTPVEG